MPDMSVSPLQAPDTTSPHAPVFRQVTDAVPPLVQLAEQEAPMLEPSQVEGQMPLGMGAVGPPAQVVGGAAGAGNGESSMETSSDQLVRSANFETVYTPL
jgi:hypothetical protein